jgi:hypothetical protein
LACGGVAQRCEDESQRALLRKFKGRLPCKVALGEKLTVQCGFAGHLFESVLNDIFENPKDNVKKAGRWRKIRFDDQELGLKFVLRLVNQQPLPVRKLPAFQVCVGGVYEVAYCEEFGELRVRCVLMQGSIPATV